MGNRNETSVEEKLEEIHERLEEFKESNKTVSELVERDERVAKMEGKIEALKWVQGEHNDL